MAQIIQKISVDVSKPNFFQAIVAKQYDSGSRFLRVTFIHCNKAIEIDPTSTVLINATRSDGEKDSFAGVVNDDNTATVPLAYWMLELEGKVECDISIIDTDGNKLTSTSFELMVERASNKGDSISEDENYDVLLQLIEEVKSVVPDQTYNPESENAQSGKAVAQALAGFEGGSNEVKSVANLILDCFENVAWANTDGETKLNALKNYIDSIDTPDEPETEEPEEDTDGYEVVRVINNDEISHLTGYTENYPYYSTRNVREAYAPFDISVEYGYTYKLEWETNCTEKVVIGYQFYNQNVLNVVATNSRFDSGDTFGFSEWQESGTEWELTETANGLPLVGMRFHFKKENDTAFVEGAGVTSVTIKRKAGRVE